MKWFDITDDITDEAAKTLQVDDVLMFNYEGSPLHLKIMRKRNGRVYAKENYLYLPDEVEVKDKVE